GWNRWPASGASSFALPFSVASFLFRGHRPRRHRVAFSVGEPDDDAEQVTAGFGLAEHIVYRVFSFGFRPLHQRPSEANLLHFLRRDAVSGNVVDPVLRPNEFRNRNTPTLRGAIADGRADAPNYVLVRRVWRRRRRPQRERYLVHAINRPRRAHSRGR